MKQVKPQRNDTLQEEVVSVSRVVKVVKGGRRFSFRALVVVGDRRGSVGIGLGKANEVSDAKAKAAHSARSNMVRIHLRDGRTLHHIVESKSGATKVLMRPAQHGAGVIAGPSLRAFLEVLGVKDVVSKCIGSTNPFTVLLAAKKLCCRVDHRERSQWQEEFLLPTSLRIELITENSLKKKMMEILLK